MNTKIVEIRDRRTLIMAVCVDMNPQNDVQMWGLRRYGHPCDGVPNILITHATAGFVANTDPYAWGDRTWATAHQHIIENWDTIADGDVVDVEYILGETATPKHSERYRLQAAFAR